MTEQQIQVQRKAEDPKAGMTVGELYAFAQAALAYDIDPRTPVRITAGWRQQIQVITTKGAS
ncbi:hypothetical protein SEA_ZUCKER_87 [Arthrobacter phage Zucker]|nr:hypothetical protein SEA_ZUCKER_87 [Arthrobacter phage Zucker]